LCFSFTSENRGSARNRQLRPRAIVVLLFILGMKILHVTFISALPGAASFAIAYFTYCFLVAACVQIPYRIIRYPMMIVVALPICAGYLLATIGALGLMFILGDAFSQPTHVEKMGTNLVCEISMWGAAGSSSGYAVHLYELWPAFPFIEREVVALTVVQAGYVGDTAPEDKTCNDASKVYSR
jgi:hypothetical protein